MEQHNDNELVEEVARRGLGAEVLARMTFTEANEALRELHGAELALVPDPPEMALLETTFETGMVTELRDGDVVLVGVGNLTPFSAFAAKGEIQEALQEDLGVKVTARVLTGAEGLFQVLRAGR